MLVNKREGVDLKHCNDPRGFIKYSNDMNDFYKNTDEYNPSKKQNVDHIWWYSR